jgi:hypothetical protein
MTFPQITEIATTLSGIEQASIGAVLIGLVGLFAARMAGGNAEMPRRAYGKVYGGAPGADHENKPDAA